MTSEATTALIARFWATMETNDFHAVGAFLHNDYILDWPQSGERVHGRDNFAAINTHYPANGRWSFTVLRIIADATSAVSEVIVTDSVVTARVITFSDIRDGLIVYQREYWPDPFAAAEWRSRWVEHL